MRWAGKWLLICLVCPFLGRAEGVIQAKGLTLTFFSSSTSQAFCRLKADTVKPATRRHGPFVMPGVGFDIINPRMELLGLQCGPKDWALLMDALAGWARAPAQTSFGVTLPDKRVVTLGGMPQVRANRMVAPVGDVKRHIGFLCIEHDGGSGLRVRLLGGPLPVAATVQDTSSNSVN